MTGLRGEELTEAHFERVLLDSAREDSLSDARARDAWMRFAGAASGVVLSAGSETIHSGISSFFRSTRAKWFALGAAGGGVVAGVLLGITPYRQNDGRAPPPGAARTVQVVERAVSPAKESIQTAAHSIPDAPAASIVAGPSLRADGKTASANPQQAALVDETANGRSALPDRLAPDAVSSRLAAEIAALDGIQVAISVKAFEQALQGVEKYHSRFPNGQLAPEAEALAVETLRALGERTEASRRAAAFLRRHPNGPHASKMQSVRDSH